MSSSQASSSHFDLSFSAHSPHSSRATTPDRGPESSSSDICAPPVTTTDPAPPEAKRSTPLSLSSVLTRLRSSPGWIGNAADLMRYTEWVEDSHGRSWFLRVKPNITASGLTSDGSENVVVSFIGVVGARDSSITPHGEFKSYFRDPEKHKRIIRMIRLPVGLHPELGQIWTDQLKGAKVIVEKGRRMENGNEPKISYSFLEEDSGALKARSLLFQKDGSPWEADTPEGYHYSTWNMPTEIRMIFDGVRSNNYTPRVLEAYDAFNNLIHPNEVARRLTGSIVYVTCTLEKMLFRGQKVGGAQWQMYANLVKIQLVAPHLDPLAVVSPLKRKAADMREGEEDTPVKQSKRIASAV